MGKANLSDVNPAVLEHLHSRGVMIPGHPKQTQRRTNTPLWHRKAFDAAGYTEFPMFDTAKAPGVTNIGNGQLPKGYVFEAQTVQIRIVAGIHPTTGAAIAASDPFATGAAAAAATYAPITVRKQLEKLYKLGRVQLMYDDYDWMQDSPSLDQFPWGGGLAGDLVMDDGAVAQVVNYDSHTNGVAIKSNVFKLTTPLCILPQMTVAPKIVWPAALALGTAATGNVAGWVDFYLGGILYNDGNA